jgi:hypothetical protein
MGKHARHTKVGQEYAKAYAAHYTTKDLLEALELYSSVVDMNPDSEEAGYSRSQLLNIVHGVVPERELLDVQVDLARGRLGREGSAGAESAPTDPPGPETDEGKDTADDEPR